MSCPLETKIKNQKLSLLVSKDRQSVCWKLENLFDERKYIGYFDFDPEQTQGLIKLIKKKGCQIKYNSNQQVILRIEKCGNFTLNLAIEHQGKNEENGRGQMEEEDTLNAFSVDQEVEKKDAIKGQKVLHEQYDDMNPSYIKYSNIFPYSSQVSIRSIYSVDGKIIITQGSGCLISPLIVLTCAHNVFNVKHLVKCIAIEVKPYGKEAIDVKYYKFPEQFAEKTTKRQNDDSEYDYAILVLKKPYQMKPLSLLINFQEKVVAEIPGYPISKNKVELLGKQRKRGAKIEKIGDKPDYNINTYRLKNARNILQKYQEHLIPHRISTAKGQSGSPIIVELQKSQFFVIGIHVADDRQNQQNLAVRLSPRVWWQIIGWCSQVPIPESPYNFIKTVMPTIVDYKSLGPISECGFSLRDIEKEVTRFQDIGKLKEEKLDYRKAAEYYSMVKMFNQEFKTNTTQTNIVKMSIKVSNYYRLYQQQHKKRLDQQYQMDKVKIPKDIQLTYFKLAKEELRKCSEQASLVLLYVEYFQLFCEVMKRLIQFQEEGNKFGKHKVFEGLLMNLEDKQVQSIRKYARDQNEVDEIVSYFNYLKYQCYLKLGQSYSDQRKRKLRNAFQCFKFAQFSLQLTRESTPQMFIHVYLQIFHLCVYQSRKLTIQMQEDSDDTLAMQYAAKMIQKCIGVSKRDKMLLEKVIRKVQSGLVKIMTRQLPQKDRPKIERCLDIILEHPKVVFVTSSKQSIMNRFKFV